MADAVFPIFIKWMEEQKMKKLSEYKNEEALDLLADIMVPIAGIMTDKNIRKKFTKNRIEGISYLLKHHKKAVLEIMAILDGVPVKEYTCNMITLPKQILEILNDADLMDFFDSSLEQEEN